MTVSVQLHDLDVGSARLFLTVAELGSVSKAAARHGLTQPSATARLQKLERQIGIQLLDRSPTGSIVTDDGRRVAEWCATLVAAAGNLTEQARSLREERAPRLRLAATATIARWVLPRWVSEEPLDGMDLSLSELTTADVAHALRRGDADLGFVDGPGAPLSLRSAIVDWIELVVVVHPEHPWVSRRRRVTGSQLAAAHLILRRRGSGTLDVIESSLAEYELGAPSHAVLVPSTAAARLAAMNREGVAILPTDEVADDVTSGRLVIVPVKGVDLRQPVRAAWKGSAPAHAGAAQLLDSIRQRA